MANALSGHVLMSVRMPTQGRGHGTPLNLLGEPLSLRWPQPQRAQIH
jgi:hypothetical protein